MSMPMRMKDATDAKHALATCRIEVAKALADSKPDPAHYADETAWGWAVQGWALACAALAQLHQHPSVWRCFQEKGLTDVEWIKSIKRSAQLRMAEERDPPPAPPAGFEEEADATAEALAEIYYQR